MSAEVPDYARELFEKIARENGFNNFSMEIETGSLPGDGFNSDIHRIKITEIGSSKKLELLSKLAPSSESRRKEFLTDVIFKRESSFYQNFVPMFEKFQAEKNLAEDDQFRAFPRCYGAIIDDDKQQYIIVLEDLKPLGFKMWDKSKPSPLENTRITVRELGKFHGFSVALKNQKPNEFKIFNKLTNMIPEFLKSKNTLGVVENSFEKAEQVLKNPDHKKIALHIKSNLMQYLSHCFSETASEHVGVFCHGRFSINKIQYLSYTRKSNFSFQVIVGTLFRFNEQGVAEEVRILDWQICHFGSPAIDFLYIIFTSTEKSLRDKEYQNLLKLYYDSFSRTVKLLGSDPEKLFSYADLLDELKIFGVYTLMLVPLILQISQADPSEIPNFDEQCDKAAEDGGGISVVNDLSGNAQLEYERRLNEVFEDIINLGYF